MKKLILAGLILIALSVSAWAFCNVDFSCKVECTRNCVATGMDYATCGFECTKVCMVCN